MAEPSKGPSDDKDPAWQRERLENLRSLGGVIAALGWFVAFLGVLIAVRWQGVISQLPTQPGARLEALVPPLLLVAAGLGLAGFGRLLQVVPAICGLPEPEEARAAGAGRPRTLAAFVRTMRSHQG
jgi:hypothetical protein